MQNGIAIYFPYSKRFKDKEVQTITIVTATEVDSDVGMGIEYRKCGKEVCSKQVTVDDKYAQKNPTYIVQGGGAEVAKYKLASKNAGGRVATGTFLKVWIGTVRCIKQYDRLISLTGNGGGSEIKITRTSAYLKQETDGQINSPGNVVSADIPRDMIDLGIPVIIFAEWDQNWEEGDKEQFFAIYEEDTKGSGEYGGSIKTTLKVPGSASATTEGSMTVKINVQTQDEIIVQHGWERAPFLAGNNSNQTWGIIPAGSSLFVARGLGDSDWAVYDGPFAGFGGANVSFVTPHRFY